MGSLFLFISLAVLVGIVGLLAYYFKSRLAEVESKNLKSLEIIEGMYSQQQQMKQYILGGGLKQHQQQQDSSQYDERIKIVLDEDDDDEEEDEHSDDEEEDEDSDDEEEDEEEATEVKKISVDMSFPAEFEIDIDEEEPEYIPEDEPEVNIDEEFNQSEEIVVNKLDEAEHYEAEHYEAKHYEAKHNNDDIDFEITAVKTNDKDNYKKMSITALKNVLHSRGIVTDSTKLNKMKKSEIIDLLLVASLAQ